MVRRAEVGAARGGSRALSQAATAAAAGLTRDRFLRIENELTEPTAEECMAIALALGTTAEAVFPDFAERFPAHAEPTATDADEGQP